MRTIPDSELKQHVVSQDDLESGDADTLFELPVLSKKEKLKVWLSHGASLLKKHRLKMIAFLVVCGFLVCGAVIVAQAVVIFSADKSSDVQSIPTSSDSGTCNPTFGTVPVEQASMVRYSSEYQIQFVNVSEMWIDRWNETAVFAQAFSEFSSYVNITADDFYEVLFSQDNADSDACGASDYLKIRQYYSGSNYATSLNIKANAHSEQDAASKPFWPSTETFNSKNDTTFQKCERDVHDCGTKYSRESSTLLQEHTKFSTCNDVIRLFPWAFPAMPYDDMWTHIPIKKREYWWLGKYVGMMSGTAFEIEITLQYSNEDDLLHETNPPTYGEWSIRIFTMQDGFSDHYEPDVLADVENVWHSMITRFGNEDSSC